MINSLPDRQSISAALSQLYSDDFQSHLSRVLNPYGDGGANERILQTLKIIALDDLLKKPFYRVPSA